jgi:tetratricopeptide (TPR) repeat protein
MVRALLILSLVACRNEKPVVESKTAPSATAAKPAPKASSSLSSLAPRPVDEAEKKAAADYQAAMNKGRAATLKKDYDGAIAAFDVAIKARPNDARALSERGYARLLAKDWDGAEKDLQLAQKHAGDRALQGQIWYNLGLTREGRGDVTGAKHAFAASDLLNPTAAAKKKLAGAAVCSVELDESASKATSHDGWLALYKSLAAGWEKEWSTPIDDPAKDDAAARESLCAYAEQAGCKGPGPWVVRIGMPYIQQQWALVADLNGKLVAFERNSSGSGGRCAYTPDISIEADGLIHVLAIAEGQELTYINATGKTCTPDEEGCQSACFAARWERVDAVYDLKALTRLLRVEQGAAFNKGEKTGDMHTPPVRVVLESGRAKVSGGGCDRTIAAK